MRILIFLLSFLFCHGLVAQFLIKGKVIGADDKLPLPQLTVLVEGTDIVTSTNLNGEFTLNVPNKNVKITFRYLGYRTKTIKPDFEQYMLVKISPDCTHHHFHSRSFKLYAGADKSNDALAGRVEFPVFGLYKAITSSYELSGLGGQETHRIDMKAWDFYHNCRWDLNAGINYRNYQIETTGFDFGSLMIAPSIGFNNYELVLGVGKGKLREEDQSYSYTGIQLGINSAIHIKLWSWWEIPIEVRATKWNSFWAFESSVDFFIWPVGLRISYNRISNFNQFSLMVGMGL